MRAPGRLSPARFNGSSSHGRHQGRRDPQVARPRGRRAADADALQSPDVVRALFMAADSLEARARLRDATRACRATPARPGRRRRTSDCSPGSTGAPTVEALAATHERTRPASRRAWSSTAGSTQSRPAPPAFAERQSAPRDRIAACRTEQDTPGARPGSRPTRQRREGRLRVMQVILSRGFAGSERAAARPVMRWRSSHDVALVVRSDHRSGATRACATRCEAGVRGVRGAGLVGTRAPAGGDDPRVAARTSYTLTCAAARATSRSCARSAVHVSTLHLSINGPHYLLTDGLFCISEWQLATVPGGLPRPGCSWCRTRWCRIRGSTPRASANCGRPRRRRRRLPRRRRRPAGGAQGLRPADPRVRAGGAAERATGHRR